MTDHPDGHDGPDKAPRKPLRAGRRPRRPEPPTAQGRPADYAGPTVEGRGHLTRSRPQIEASHQRDPRCGIWTTSCPSTSTRRHRMRHLPDGAGHTTCLGRLASPAPEPIDRTPPSRRRRPAVAWPAGVKPAAPQHQHPAGSRSSARRPVVVARAEVTGPVSNMPTVGRRPPLALRHAERDSDRLPNQYE